MGDSLTLHRAYAVLDVKAVDDEQRIIEGIASTPEVDRMGDIVEPDGAIYKLPIPLLWQHRSDQPIGHVISAKVTKSGIQIKAQIAKGVLPRIDEAWALLKAGLVRGLSIGFSAKEFSHIDGGHGLRFLKWEWLELSAVTIPANAEASITAIKQFDAEHLAASGEGSRLHTPAVVGTPVVKLQKPATVTPMNKTYSERIQALEATRAAKAAEIEAIQTKVSDEGRTKESDEREKFDTLKGEITSIDAELADLRELEKLNVQKAAPVAAANPAQASGSRDGQTVSVSVKGQNLPPGIGFARAVMAKSVAAMDHRYVIDVAKEMFPSDDRLHAHLKAAVPAGTSTQTVWAGPLVDQTNLAGEFIEYLRPMTIVGKFGTGGIPSLRRVPFNIKVASQTSGGTGYWVGEGASKPLTSFAFSSTTLLYTKVAAIAVITQELARFSTPSAEGLVRDALAGALIERLDRDFIDPAEAGTAAVQPASITNGLTAQSSAGTSADNARTDLTGLLSAFIESNIDPTSLVLIMPNTLALALSLMVNSLGQPEFPGLTMRGGTLQGIPVITSQYAANASGGGNLVIAVNAGDVFLADDGQVTVDASTEASLQMADAPTGNSATATGVSVVSMYQTNSIALRAERFINWAKRRSEAVVYMDDVNWGSVGSPS